MSSPSFIPFRLDGDVAIVTGAGSRLSGEIGNGRAISILLARQGAKVALLDIKKEWAQETKDVIAGEGGTAEVFECDVSVEESCKAAVSKVVGLWGSVRILVNNGEHPLLLLAEIGLVSGDTTLLFVQLVLEDQ